MSGSSNGKVDFAIVGTAPSPYRLRQHRRIVAEADPIRLHSVFTHEHNIQPWTLELPEEINPTVFGPGERTPNRGKPLNQPNEWSKMGRVIKYLEEHDVKGVLTTGYSDAGRARLAMWAEQNDVPLFMFCDSNIHGDNATGLTATVKRAYVRWFVSKLTGMMPCGRTGRAYLERYGGGGKPMYDMPHEPDYDLFSKVDPARVDDVRAKHGISNERRHLLYCARLHKVKRPDTLIDAFARISDERPDWDLVMIGGGPLEAEMHARVPEHLKSRVKWLGFLNDPQEIAAIYHACDVYVLPSSYEPWAVTVVEAAAAEIPLVISKVVGAAAELVEDDRNGRLFTPGDVDDLTSVLRSTTEPETLARYRANAPEVIRAFRERTNPARVVVNAMRDAGVLS